MFSALWFILVGTGSVCSALFKNETLQPRTFLRSHPSVTDEPFDMDLLNSDDNVKWSRAGGARLRNASDPRAPPTMSDAALLFLSGPVSTIFIPCFYTLVCVVSVPINVCAVLAFARGIRPKKPAAIYMLNLAGADLLFALLLPFKIFYHLDGNNWRFGAALCRVVTAAFYWNMYCSVLLIACISVDRLLAVVYPIDSLAWRRPRNAVVACVTMWALSLAGSAPLVVSDQTVYLPELNVTTCHDVQDMANVRWLKAYFLTMCTALFLLPLVLTVASYSRVIWSLSSVPKGVSGSSRRRRRAVVMTLTVLLIFVLCFLPTNCLMLAHYVQFGAGVQESRDTPDGSYALYLVFLCVGSLNCVLDPLVYYFGSSQCQRQLTSVLRCRRAPRRGASSSGQTSSDSCRSSSTRTVLKSSRTQSSKTSGSGAADSLQAELDGQYRKLLV